jgi:hypothetical protein
MRLCLDGQGQRVEDVTAKPFAGVPDLYCDELMGAFVVVAQPAGNTFADDVVGLSGGDPGDVGVGS